MKDQDCYFMVDPDPLISEDKRCMLVFCLPCRDKLHSDQGWFYKGSEEGYGPFDFICDGCGATIHKENDSPITLEDIEKLLNQEENCR